MDAPAEWEMKLSDAFMAKCDKIPVERQKGDIMSILEVNLTVEERCAIREMDGYVRGKEESKREIARNLKTAGLDVKMIADNTGLTVEEIEEL